MLHALAAHGGTVEALERILQRIGEKALAITNINGVLALHLAAQNQRQSAGPGALKMLQATPPEALAQRTTEEANVLHFIAATPGNHGFLESFISALPLECLLERDVHGRTPLHTAADEGDLAVIPLLEATPVEVLLMEEESGLCPLELALLRHRLDAFPAMIAAYEKSGILKAKKEWRAISPLHLALDRCEEDVVSALLACPQAKEWVLIRDPVTGVLPLHYVVGKSNMFNPIDLRPLLALMSPEDVATPIAWSGSTWQSQAAT